MLLAVVSLNLSVRREPLCTEGSFLGAFLLLSTWRAALDIHLRSVQSSSQPLVGAAPVILKHLKVREYRFFGDVNFNGPRNSLLPPRDHLHVTMGRISESAGLHSKCLVVEIEVMSRFCWMWCRLNPAPAAGRSLGCSHVYVICFVCMF
jgi:hypothetical protein